MLNNQFIVVYYKKCQYLCKSKLKINNMKYEQVKNQFLKNVAEAKYKYASDLLDLVEDKEVIGLYQKYNKIFATLSGMSKEQILNSPELLDASIEVLEDYFDNYVSEDEFNNMERDEQIQLIVDALDDCNDLYGLFASLI